MKRFVPVRSLDTFRAVVRRWEAVEALESDVGFKTIVAVISTTHLTERWEISVVTEKLIKHNIAMKNPLPLRLKNVRTDLNCAATQGTYLFSLFDF